MRIIILYRPESEHARVVETYIADFQRFHPGETIETFNIDSIEGSHLVELYGVTEYPTVIAAGSDGVMQQMWSGVEKLPLMNDLAYFATQ